MPRFSLPDVVLDEIVHRRWGVGPAVWRAPATPPFADEAEVLAALRALHARLDGGDASVMPRVHLDAAPTGFRLDTHLPAEGMDFATYEDQLRGWAKGRGLGMVLHDAQALGGRVWSSAVGVARDIHRRRGLSSGGAFSEIFLGNYRTSFFGVHKDALETLTFVVRGRKRFLVWPYEVFADQPEVVPNGERVQIKLAADLDLTPFRDRATILEGGPGDVFFWPASAWHVAEGVDDAFVTTVTVAFFPSVSRAPGCPFRLTNEAIARFGDDGFDSADPAYPAPTGPEAAQEVVDAVDATLARLLEDPTVRRARREFALKWATGQGFQRVPAEGVAPELDADTLFEVDPENPLWWADVEEDGFPTSVNGLTVTAVPKFLPMVKHLNEGGVFRVGDIVDTFGLGGDAPAAAEILEALGALGAVRYFRVVCQD